MTNLPTILLTFANDYDDPLSSLKLESHVLFKALESVENKGIVKVERHESATIDIVTDRLNALHQDLCIFHYAGHADGDQLKLENGTAYAIGLAKLIADAPNLQLVVLNGCATYGQVELLFELGVKAIIATSEPIGDTKAKEIPHIYSMMLTLFAASSELMNKNKDNKQFDFKPRMMTYNELMSSFMEA